MANDRTGDQENIEFDQENDEFEQLGDNPDYAIRLGSTDDNLIDAGAGDDVVMTGSGNDYVRGGEGNDYISTGAGDDTLAGGAGFNVLSGGSGRDTFLFDADDLGEPGAYAVNTITDFDPEEDRLRLTGFDFANFTDIPAFVSATGVMLQIAPNKIILLQNVFSLEALAEAVDLGDDQPPAPPEVTLDLETDTGLPDDGVTSEIVLEGTFTGTEVTTLLLSIDGGAEVNVTAALNPDGTFRIAADLLGSLEDGAHSFEIRALDAAGQSSEPVSLAVVLDATAPGITDITLDPQSDTGIAGDGITGSQTITLTGTAEAGSTLTLQGKSVVADSFGRFSLEGIALTEGMNLLSVTATDAAGNSATRDLQVALDSIGPVLENLALDPDSDSGIIGDFRTETGAALIINGRTEAGALVTIGDITVTADASGAFAINAGSVQAGDNPVLITSEDAAGNVTGASLTIIGETPDLPVPNVEAELVQDSGFDATDGITSDLSLAGSVSEATSLLTISLGDGPAMDITDQLTADSRFSLNTAQLVSLFGALTDGALSFAITAENADGQSGTVGIVDAVFDSTAPDADLGLASGFDSGEPGDGLTNLTIVDLAGQVTDANPHALFLNGEEIIAASGGSFSLTDVNLTEGENSFELVAEDAAGNRSTQNLVITVDSLAPDLTDLALDPDSDTGEKGDNATDLRSVTLTGQAEPGATVSIGTAVTIAGSDGSFSLPNVPIELGPNTLTLTATDAAGNSSTASLEIEGTESATGEAPEITGLALTNDTGSSATDKITSDAGLSGTFAGGGEATTLMLSVNGGAPLDVSSALSGDGFVIDANQVAAAAGGTLPEGRFTVSLTAGNAAGQSSTAAALTATLDTGTPVLSGLALAASSDTGVQGDGITSLRSVRIIGEGEAGATVVSGDARTVVGLDGKFALNGVPVAEGDNTLSLTITDKAGNSSTSTLEVTGIQGVEGQPVLVWNDITLEAIADNAATATGASRVLAMQSVAVYDVVAAIDDAPAFLVNAEAADGADLAAAIAQASHTVLSYAFPAFQTELDAYLAEALANVPDGAAEDAGIALGQLIAERVIAIRDADGWDDFEPHPGSTIPGEWRETGPMFGPAAAPEWATMETWALESAEQFRADAPPALDSAEYAASVARVQEIGSATSTTRTADQTEAARFWKDGQGTETTPGHWNSIATDLMKDTGTGTGDAARALAMLNVSVADAMIAAWDTKYTYDFWRPVNAIRLADQDGNAETTADRAWNSLMLSPSHPEYVSGHAAASGAAAETLTALFGMQDFTTESLGLAGVSRSFESFWQAAEENADSREWGGVHFDFSNETGLVLGAEVANWAIAAFNDQTDTAAPVVIVDISLGYTGELPFAITGTALDTLSGIESLTASVDGGAALELALSEDGSFSYAFDAATADGSHEVVFIATDAAGNLSRSVKSTIVVDTVAPELTLSGLTDGILSGADARLTGTIDGTGAPIIELAYQINDAKTFALPFNQTTGAFDSALNLSAVSEGASTVTVIAIDAAGNSIRKDFALEIDEAIPFTITSVMPKNLSGEVGSTFRPEIHFSRPVDPDTVTSESFFLKDAGGRVLDANVRVSADGLKAWLFPAEPMPGANTIRLTLRGDLITSEDGTALDGDGDGEDGGNLLSSFRTVSTTAVANTSISGFIIDPGADLKPMTTDDYSAGADGVDYTDDDVFLTPIAGAKVFILGLEHISVTTDENGYFELTNVPAGNVKVAVDGRTATNAPEGVFWPEMVMDANIVAGQANTLMAAMNTGEQKDALAGRGEVYLPRVSTEILQDISETEETEIGMPVSAAEDLTTEQREAIRLVVQPGSAVDEHGNPVEDAQVGISTVPAELVMDMLPDGLMQHTFDLTIQAPDSAVFTTPAELTVPNIFDAPPGTKLNVLSFDHTTGRLVIEGTATVSADGETVTTDPGTGITKPGWHGFTPTGTNVPLPRPKPEPPKEEPDPDCEKKEFLDDIGDVSAIISDLSACMKLIGPFSTAITAFKVAIIFADTVKLTADIGRAVLKVKEAAARGDSADVVLSLIDVVDDYKDRLVQLADQLVDTLKGSPWAAAITCGKNLSGIAETICNQLTSDPCTKDNNNASAVCDALGIVKRGFTAIDLIYQTWINKAENLGLVAVCATIDVVRDLGDQLIREGRGRAAVTKAAEVGDPSASSTREELIAALEELEIETEASRIAAEDGKATVEMAPPPESAELAEAAEGLLNSFAALDADLFGVEGRSYLYLVKAGDQVLRGSVEDDSAAIFLPANEQVEFFAYDVASGEVAHHLFITGDSGVSGEMPSLLFFDPKNSELLSDDIDGDGLIAIVEEIIGTSDLKTDTDGDGLTDKFEIENDLDPLSGFATTTGLLDTLPLSGKVEEIAITADIPGQETIALVASGQAGLSILDLTERTAPRLLAQLDMQGNAVDVSVDGQLALAAVAIGSAIRIIDVSSPADPQIITTISESVSQIEAYSGRLYAADDGEILVYDLLTGDRLQREDLPSSASSVRAMTMESGLLYVIDNTNTLSVFEIADDLLTLRGTLGLSGQSWASGLRTDKLFASDGVLYVPADAGFNAGYGTIDISDPENMSVLSGPDDRALSGTDFADAGNGIGITVGRLGGVFGTNSVMVVNNSDPTDTGRFVTRFDLDAPPTATVVSAGFVYVGDDEGNFHVINALGFDTNGIAPEIGFEPVDIDADPATLGIQIEEGTDVRLPISLTDDVQIQKVELLVNGEVVRTDLSIPYDLKFRVPNLADGVTSGTFQVRATDTGGNVAVSEAIEFDIIEDITPPEIIRLTPADGGLTLVDGTTVRVVFSEPVDAGTISRALATLVNDDGQTIEAASVAIIGQDRVVQFDFGTMDLGAYTLSVDLTAVTDLAGNALGGAVISQSLEVVDATAVWTDPNGGNWNDTTKWRDGVLPTDTDGVALVLNEDATVIHRNLTTEVERILVNGTLDLQSGTLQAGLIEGSSGRLRTSGGTLRDTEIAGGEGFTAFATGGTWSNVTLSADGFIGDGESYVVVYVDDGLRIDGELELTGGASRYAYLYLNGDETVDGSGVLRLNDQRSYVQLRNLDSSLRETALFGADLSIEGQGQITASRSEDRLQILGDVTATGGRLYMSYIDNAGESLSLDSAGGGWVELSSIENTIIDVAEGADLRLQDGSTHSDITFGGAGVTRVQNATVNGLTVSGEAVVEGTVANATAYLYVNEELTVDGVLSVASTATRNAYLNLRGEQTIDGSGEILLSRANAVDGTDLSGRNWISLQGQFYNEGEVLTFGEDLTIAGEGTVTSGGGEDRIRILGDVRAGEDGRLIIEYLDNNGEALSVDASEGEVVFRTILENTVVNGTGMVSLNTGVNIEEVTFNMDARIGDVTGSNTVYLDDGLTLNASLELASAMNRNAYLHVNGEQVIDGNGSIDLTRANAPSGNLDNRVRLVSQSADAEVLTFGTGIEITGTGLLEASRPEDRLQILGTVIGRDGGLTLTDIDNQGEALKVDASEGDVILADRIENTIFEAAEGQSGRLTIGANTVLDNVTLNMATEFGSENYLTFTIENGLTVNSEFTLASGANRYAYMYLSGEQVIDGDGIIRLSDINAPLSDNLQNYIYLQSELAGSEIVTISEDITIAGEGRIRSASDLDEFLIEGAVIADHGTLQADDIAALEGLLGATADGDLWLSEGIELTERGTLAVGLSGSDAEMRNGQIRVTGTLEQKGTLALDIADDFDAEIGDEFIILTSTRGLFGSFDNFEGFDLEGNTAFELIEKDENTLAIRVTTDEVARDRGFIDLAPFVPETRPVFQKTDIILDDTQTRITDANIIGDISTPGNGPAVFENVTFSIDTTIQAFSSNPTLTIEQGIEFNDVTITQNGSSQAHVVSNYQGTQTVSGTGLIDFVRDSGLGQSDQHNISLISLNDGRETLTIEEGITLRGHAVIGVNRPGTDRIKMLGTLEGVEGSILTIRDLDNDGEAVTIDATFGTVSIGSWARETVFEQLTGSSGMMTVLDGALLDDVTFTMDVVVDASAAASRVDVYSGLTLDNATFALHGFNNLAELEFLGSQAVTGEGILDLTANPAGMTNNAIRLNGVSTTGEVLTFGENITLRGTGSLSTDDEGDTIRILGDVVTEGGSLTLDDIDNGGSAFEVDASGGTLRLDGLVSHAALMAATGNTGFAELSGGLRLEDVELGIDARIEAGLSSRTVTLREGLTLSDSMLTLAGSEPYTGTLTVIGPQTIDGNGEIFLSDENAIAGRPVRNTISFSGRVTDSEVFVIGEAVTLRGTGDIVVTTGDVLDLQGNIIAEGGALSLQGVSDMAGNITIEGASLLDIDRDLSFADSTGLTISLSGAGLDATAGLLDVEGLLRRDGSLNFDIDAGFDAEIGTEFEIIRTSDGFNIDGFDEVTGFVINDDRSLALIESGNSIFARVVGTDQGGQQLGRDDLPAAPVFPVLNQNYTDQTLDEAFIGGAAALFTGGTWSNVTLSADGFIGDGESYVVVYADDGLKIDGDLELTGGASRYAYLYLNGDETVDGSGVLRLNDQRSYVQLRNLDSSLRETAIFGADLSIEGQGQITASRQEDRLQILGDVTAVGGRLYMSYIDNAGESLSLDSAGGGWVELSSIGNTIIEVAEGADLRLQDGSTHSNITFGGAGVTRVQNATVNGLTVSGEAVVEGTVANATAYLYVNEDLTVDGVLSVASTATRNAYLNLRGEQTIEGSGEILLSRANAVDGADLSGRNWISLQGQFYNEGEVLTFGEDLTIAGEGTVTSGGGEDRIRILGDVRAGEDGRLIIEYLDNDGEALSVDASEGEVVFRTILENTVVNGTGMVSLNTGVNIEDVTFNMDARIGDMTGSGTVYLDDGLTLNASLELASAMNRNAYLHVNGEQVIDGNGSIDLTRANAPSGNLDNRVRLVSQSADAEVLTFGAGIEITGTGRLEANSREDRLQILGTVIGRDGALTVTDIDNQGEALKVDASEGDVILADRIENTIFEAAEGQSGRLTIGANTVLDNVTLNMATEFGSENYLTFTIENGLTVNSEFTLASGANRYAYMYLSGEQVIDGDGIIRLSDINAPLSTDLQNYIYLQSELAGSEIVTISEDITIAGEGRIRSASDLDEFLIEGAVIADHGTLQADDIAALEGLLGATADGDLWLSEGIELTERGTLAVGLSGSDAEMRNGQIRVTGTLEQKGTLALDIADDFDAEIGDEFIILTSTRGLFGSFDNFEGFDLEGNTAFELIEKDENTLAIRVTTDELAAPFNLADDFVFDL